MTNSRMIKVGQALSAREEEVLCLVAHGFSDAEIAPELDIAETTVAKHIRLIMLKLGLHRRTLLALYALKAGLVRLEDIQLLGEQ